MTKGYLNSNTRKEYPAGITLRKDGQYLWRFKYAGVTYSGYCKSFQMQKKLCGIKGMRLSMVLFINKVAGEYSKPIASMINFLLYDSLRQAARNRIIAKNPMENTTPPKFKKQKKKGALTVEAGKYWKPLEEMEDMVFTTNHGTPHYDMNIRTDQRKIVARIKEKGGDIDGCTFHTLRHCFATRCIENGMDPKTLQAILGHSTFAMTMDLYCDVMEDVKRDEMKKIMQAL